MRNKWVSLLAFIVGIMIVQGLGNLATMKEIPTWYATLNKAPWNPPNWVFGPMWTILYVMIAVSGWLLWTHIPGRVADKLNAPALRFYFIQLFLNLIWSPLFFGLHWTMIALVDIVLMVVFIALTIMAAKKVHRVASYLLVPYMLWVIYATSLNAYIMGMN